VKHALGIHYNCTVISSCTVRSLLHSMMGYYTFLDDLPDPIPPHLQPIQGDGLQLAPELLPFGWRLRSSQMQRARRPSAPYWSGRFRKLMLFFVIAFTSSPDMPC
jgi:hypothetical protein